MSLPTGLPMPWSWGEVWRGISTGVSHGPKLQERQRPVCKAAGFWELGCPAPSGGRSSIWQNIPTDHNGLSEGLCCTCHTYRVPKSSSSLGINKGTNEREWLPSSSPIWTLSVWPGFSFSLIETKLSLGVGACASRPHMSIYSLGRMTLSYNTQPNRVMLF